MNLSDAVKSIIKPHEEDTLTPLSTIFGERLDKSNILSEYPRPQMVRQSCISLNGSWDYAITRDSKAPARYEGHILVPSPRRPPSPALEDSLGRMNISGTAERFPWMRPLFMRGNDFFCILEPWTICALSLSTVIKL